MLELEDALARILARLPKPTIEQISLTTAYQRISAARICAPLDLPVFDNSSMDGYAVRSVDVASATPKTRISLRVTGRVPAGESFAGHLAAGESVRVFTGSPLPQGADAVVMQEDIQTEDKRPNEVFLVEPIKRWENVRFRGEDVKRGTLLLQPGEVLTAGRIALLAAMGLAEVKVGSRPTVGLIATGSELKEPGEPLARGQIYESNRIALAPFVRNTGGLVKIFPVVPDDLKATREALEHAFGECDIVITCGGVSVGEMDFVKAAFEQLGGTLNFWKVAIKPGRPFVFGQLATKFLFGLPGNPVSALVTFLLLARPALLNWQGSKETSLPRQTGTLAEPLENTAGRRHFMRVRIDASGMIHSAGIQASHVLSSTAAANGLVDVSPKTNLPAGTVVGALRWD